MVPVIVASLLVAGGAAFVLFYLSRPHMVERRCLKIALHAKTLQDEDPGRARREYRRVIASLGQRREKIGLGEDGKLALGMAYHGECLGFLADRKPEEARKFHKLARGLIDLPEDGLAVPLAEIAAEKGELTPDAQARYHHYLRLPQSQGQSALTGRVLGLLERHCQIDEQTPNEQLKNIMRENLAVTCLPAAPPRLVVQAGPDAGVHFVLQQGSVSIGRNKPCGIRPNDRTVSREHAAVSWQDGRYVLQNLSQSNPTCVRKQRVGKPVVLSDGDRIRCGNTVFEFVGAARVAESELEWPHFNLGLGYHRLGHLELAQREFLKAQALRPDRAESYFYLGSIHRSMGLLPQCQEDFSAALALAPKHAGAHHGRGEALLASLSATPAPALQEKPRILKEALSHLKRAVSLESGRHEYYRDLASACAVAGQTHEALDAIQRAIGIEGRVGVYHLLLARLAFSLSDWKLARQAAGRSVELDGRVPETSHILAHAAFEQRDYLAAADEFTRLQAQEREAESHVYSATDEFAYRWGRSLFEVKRYVAAAASLAPIAKRSREAMFYGGRCNGCTGNDQKAEEIYRWILSTHGEDPETRYYLAATLANQKRYREALEAVAPLRTANGWAVLCHGLAGRAYMALRQWEDAAKELEAGRALAPEDRDLNFEAGRLACVQGDFDRAAGAFRRVVELNPGDGRARLWLGRALFALGQLDEAARYLAEVLEQARAAPGSLGKEECSEACYYLARAARARRDYTAALKYYQEARKLGRNPSSLVFEMAASYTELGKFQEALAEMSALASRSTSDEVVARNMAALSCRIAEGYATDQRYEQAIPLLRQAREEFEKLKQAEERTRTEELLAEACFRLGLSRLIEGQPQAEEAAKAFQEALSLRPQDRRARYCLGVALFRAGHYGKAVACFRELAEEGDVPALKAHAQSLERDGKEEQAIAAWQKLAALPDANIEGLLGLAGLHARRSEFAMAAQLFTSILASPAARKHPAFSEIGKLAASYWYLAGKPEKAEEVIRNFLQGRMDQATVDAYLGALAAQQGRFAEAHPHLRKAAQSPSAPAEVHELFDAVCRTLAAQSVRKGQLRAALDYLTQPPRKSQETLAFHSMVQAAELLKDVGAEVTEGAVKAYEGAYRVQPKNPTVLRNFAILCHRLALRLEEEDRCSNAHAYWERACGLWREVLGAEGAFWDEYLLGYNRGRSRRDRLQREDLDSAVKSVSQRLVGVHSGYVLGYVGLGRETDVSRHGAYLKSLDSNGTLAVVAVDELVAEADKLKSEGKNREVEALVGMAYQLAPSHEKARRAYAVSVQYKKAVDCYNAQNFQTMEQHLDEMLRVDPKLATEEYWKAEIADCYLQWALHDVNEGREHSGDGHYAKAKQYSPGLESDKKLRIKAAQYYLLKAVKAVQGGYPSTGRGHLQKAINLDPRLYADLAEVCGRLNIPPPIEAMAEFVAAQRAG